MKRSNRLVMLIGIFLAIVAFVGVLYLFNQGGEGGGGARNEPSTTPVVIAARDIPLGAKITADMVKTKEVAIANKPTNGYADVSYVIGQTARAPVTAEQLITTDILSDTGSISRIEVPTGKVAIAIQVDQVSGVGTITKAGDHIDLLVGLTGDKFPVVTLNPDDNSVTVVSGLNSTSVKLLLQGMQVLGTLLPPPPADTGNNTEGGTSSQTALTGQSQIIIVAVDAKQAEVIKYAQLDGSISVVLRSADDFRDPTTGLPLDPALIIPATTDGITLKSLVDDYGVLVPQLVEAILPAQPGR